MGKPPREVRIKHQRNREAFCQSQNLALMEFLWIPCLADMYRGSQPEGSLLSRDINVLLLLTLLLLSAPRMAGCWYLPHKMSRREARGNNLLKAGIFFSAGGFRGLNRDSWVSMWLPLRDFEETLWDELAQGGDFLTEIKAKRR